MTPIAITVLVLSAIFLWGGSAASIVFLRRRPNVTSFPPGGEDDERLDAGPIPRDT
ncbi:MetS family NSS transporter small subunit [Pseudoclavibacter chungangensis]|uniref:MetS family NSS transporter small subunit n=1 Tax=Pseudoclavibacter chungangensis TaxID=587635 RepID=A0A7J5C1C1_9MICO|nr:MetS family NSS transporter small subunit [Pseudoclavibacter chungangensis]KAB1662404.1 MetS family NSS transporter small subunit [Pseudoclavibacter chungangensis]NYJ68428.1 hypothetical protein [Pseudoclavibacter chungangensis]